MAKKKKVEKKLKIEIKVNDPTKKGISGLKVEAWDKDQKYDDFLGVGTTDARGKATIEFSEGRWREYAPDLPDLYFKVYHGETLLRSTEGSVIMNVQESRTETIEVNIPAPLPLGKDYVRASTVYKAKDWVRRSEIKRVGLEALDRVGTRLRLGRDAVTNTARNMDMKPVKAGGFSLFSFVGRDVKSAKEDLEANGISVEVKAYDPKLNKATLTELTALPSRLKQEQKVILYEKGGEVLNCSVVTSEPLASPELGAAVKAQEAKLAEVKDELQATRKASDKKDQIISALQEEIKDLRESHEQMKDVISSKRMTQIKEDLEDLKEFRMKIEKPQKEIKKTKRK